VLKLVFVCMQIRKLALLLAMGKRVYVHCTAGINRATLTVVGYLTFVKVCLPSSRHTLLHSLGAK
jgi:protein-tyrosine phosphatase